MHSARHNEHIDTLSTQNILKCIKWYPSIKNVSIKIVLKGDELPLLSQDISICGPIHEI